MSKQQWFSPRGYIGHDLSCRAAKAISKDEIPLSLFTRRRLARHGIWLDPEFVIWLCRTRRIRYQSRHHTGYPPRLRRFYDLRYVARRLEEMDTDTLLDEWEKRVHTGKTDVE